MSLAGSVRKMVGRWMNDMLGIEFGLVELCRPHRAGRDSRVVCTQAFRLGYHITGFQPFRCASFAKPMKEGAF